MQLQNLMENDMPHAPRCILTWLDMDGNRDLGSAPRDDGLTLGYQLDVPPVMRGGDTDLYPRLGHTASLSTW